MGKTEVQLKDGNVYTNLTDVSIAVSGWVAITFEENGGHEYTNHYPPHMVERIVDCDVNYETPHGRI